MDRQRTLGFTYQPDNKAFLFCMQNMPIIKQLSSMLVE